MKRQGQRGDLPARVFAKGRCYYLVTAQGKKRLWHKLSRISEGLPALYSALAQAQDAAAGHGHMPELIAQWERSVMPRHAAKTQVDDKARGKMIAQAFAAFRPADVEPPDCSEFLTQFLAKPRTFNAYRAALREYLRYAEELGQRGAGTNPLQAIRTLRTPARDRYITDSELRRIKVAAFRVSGSHGQAIDPRAGPMLCALVDMAYLTAQPIGDLLALDWSAVGRDGILFARGKVKHSTGAKVLIEWTPKLRDVERRLRDLRKERRAFGSHVFCRQDGQPYTYWGAASAWSRAVKRSGVAACHFHDLRAKALTDKEGREGMQAARRMGTHATEAQTADYVRHKVAPRTKATR